MMKNNQRNGVLSVWVALNITFPMSLSYAKQSCGKLRLEVISDYCRYIGEQLNTGVCPTESAAKFICNVWKMYISW